MAKKKRFIFPPERAFYNSVQPPPKPNDPSTRMSNIYKYKESEAYLQHQLYHLLQVKGINCIPEFVDGSNRYDLLVLNKWGSPLCIVEVKGNRASIDIDQINAYEQNSFHIPVLPLAGRDMFQGQYREILNLYNDKDRNKRTPREIRIVPWRRKPRSPIR